MNLSDPLSWLALYLLTYAIVTLYWARLASGVNLGESGFFNANGALAPWMSALTMAGASISGWMILGFPEMISIHGFGFAVLSVGGVVLPLAGVLFFKRQWILARRYNYSSQGEIFSGYYGGQGLSVISAGIAVIFAVAFTGMQLRAVGIVLSDVSGGAAPASSIIWMIALLLFSYTVIGGMRAVGYLGSLQTVLLGLAGTGLAISVIGSTTGFVELNRQLAMMAQNSETLAHRLFEVSGVIQFTEGIGLEIPVSNQWTAVMILSSAMALMGFQATPMATQLMLATRSPRGIAAGQTWVMAGFFGALMVFAIILIGAGGIGAATPGNTIQSLLGNLATRSPWFMAGLAVGLIASVQIVAGLSLVTASGALIRDIYIPFFHRGLDKRDMILYARIVIGLLLLTSVLLAILLPVGLSAIGSIALPSAFQLWPALIGVCWFKFVSRQAATTGAGIGIFVVLVTDNLGANMLGFLGLELPWGRWPWTIHSAAWGMFFNLLAVIVISAITRGRGHSVEAPEMRKYFISHSTRRARSRALKPAAWSAVLAWFFLALGPGVVLGNYAFGSATEGFDSWLVGMPSLWAWSLLFWVLGVFMIWFLAYKLELATAPETTITPLPHSPQLPVRDTNMQDKEVVRLVWTVASVAAVVTLVAWIFG